MNWLAYLALVFAVIFLVSPGHSLLFALASSVAALVSAVLRYEATLRALISPTLGKVIAVVVGGSALVVSPFAANTVIANLTLLSPSAFPFAHATFSLLAVIFLWLVLAWLTIAAITLYELVSAARYSSPRALKKPRAYSHIVVPIGRVAGLLLLLMYIAPAVARAVNFDSGGFLSRLIVATDFVENAGQNVSYSSEHPKLPEDCKSLAADAGITGNRGYACSAQTRHCTNLERGERISHQSDGTVIVARDVESSSPLFELNPIRFDIEKCDAAERYDIQVKETPSSDLPH